MSLLRLLPRTPCPPDKYRYTHWEDGHISVAMDRDSWFAAILKHKLDNGYELPENWRALAEDQLCRLLPGGWCEYETGELPTEFLNSRVTLDDIINGTTVLVEFVRQGMPLVDEAEAERRAKICASCYAKAGIPGCGPCVGIANLVAEVAGAKATTSDHLLENKSCLVCKCSARANVWIPVEVSQRGVSEETLRLFPTFCWKRQQIERLRRNI